MQKTHISRYCGSISFILLGLVSNAQLDLNPADQWFIKQMYPSLILYDSIYETTYPSPDTAFHFSVRAERSTTDSSKFQDFLVQGNSDALLGYRGSWLQNKYIYHRVDYPIGDTMSYDIIYPTADGRDSVQEHYWLSNGQFVKAQSGIILYQNGNVDRVYRLDNPTNLSDTTSVTYFYRHQGRLDSMVQYGFQGGNMIPMVKTAHNYQGGLLMSMDTYISQNGQFLHAGTEQFDHNSQGGIFKIDSYNGIGGPANFELTKTTEYFSEPTMGVNQLSKDLSMEWSVYPNPVNRVILIAGTKDASGYGIYSTDGRLLKEGLLNNQQKINVDDLPEATYILKVFGEYGHRQAIRFYKHQ